MMETRSKNRLIFLVLNVVAILLMLSWLMPWTAAYWQAFDMHAFYFFNGWISQNRFAQIFWSIANFRPFDLLPIAIVIFSITAGGKFIEKNIIREKAILFFFLIFMTIIIRYVVSTIYGEGRLSPSLTVKPVYLLSQLVPSIPSKDVAFESFPSDHAAILFTWMGFMLIYAKNVYKPLAIIVPIFFITPRLVSGAHWISDELVGSVFVALMSIAWVCFTPIGDIAVNWLRPIFQKISLYCYRKKTVTNE